MKTFIIHDKEVITIKFYHGDEEIIHNFPSKKEVCWNCEGHGTHLTPSIREHAYSAEEFYEAFHEEEDTSLMATSMMLFAKRVKAIE